MAKQRTYLILICLFTVYGSAFFQEISETEVVDDIEAYMVTEELTTEGPTTSPDDSLTTEWLYETKITLSDATQTSYLVHVTTNCIAVNVTCICQDESGFEKCPDDRLATEIEENMKYQCDATIPGSVNSANAMADCGGIDEETPSNETICTDPASVTDITSTESGVSDITVQWSIEGCYKQFNVTVSKSDDPGKVFVTNETSLLVEDLDEHTQYSFSIVTVGLDQCNNTASAPSTELLWTDFEMIAPTNITLDGATTTELVVTFTHDSPNMLSYDVTCECLEFTNLKSTCQNSTIAIDSIEGDGSYDVTCTGLTPGVHYRVNVSATGQIGSQETTANDTAITLPLPATDFTADSSTLNSIKFTWIAPADSGYSDFVVFNDTDNSTTGDLFLDITSLMPGTMYTYNLTTRATYSNDKHAVSTEVSAVGYTRPDKVQNLNIIVNSAWGFTVTWDEPSGNDGLEMYLVNVNKTDKEDECFSVVLKEEGSSIRDELLEDKACTQNRTDQSYQGNTSFILTFINEDNSPDEVIVPYTNYTVEVFAVNLGGIGSLDSKTAETDEAPPGSKVQNLETFATTFDSVSLEWEDPELAYGEITSYTVYWNYIDCDTKEEESDNIIVSNNKATVGNLKEYWDFTFTVEAFNSEGAGDSRSEELLAMTNATNPITMSDFDVIEVTARNATIAWQPLNECDVNGIFSAYYLTYSYINILDGETSDNFTEPMSNQLGDSSYVLLDMRPYHTYTFSVFAANTEFNGNNSQSITKDTLEDRPGKPADLNLNAGNSYINASWLEPTEPNGVLLDYLIQWCDMIYDECNDPPLSVTTTYHNITDLQPSFTYEVFVRARTEIGLGDAITDSATLGVGKPLPPEQVNVTAESATALLVNWTVIGQPTGNTSYNVTAVALDPECDDEIHVVNVQGFDNTEAIVDNLKEYWEYNVTVVAIVTDETQEYSTDAEYGDKGPPTEFTGESKPGKVENLGIDREEDICYALKVEWDLPAKCNTNGNITSYKIEWTSEQAQGGNKTCEVDGADNPCQCPDKADSFCFTVDELNPNNITYQFEVTPITATEITGNVSMDKSYTGLCPPITPPGSGIGETDTRPSNAEQQFVVAVDSAFLNDQSNGDLTKRSVIVVDADHADDDPCCDSVEEFNDRFTNWYTSKQSDFRIPYQIDYYPITENSHRLRRSSQTADFTVGEQSDCSSGEYCNGPLKDGRRFKVALATSTEGGPSFRGYSDIVWPTDKRDTNGGDRGSDSKMTALIASMSVLIVLLLGVVIVGAMYMQRNGYLDRFLNALIVESFGAVYMQRNGCFDRFFKSEPPNEEPFVSPTLQMDEVEENIPDPVPVERFREHVAHQHKDTNMLFAHEYEKLREVSPIKDSYDANKPENKAKNRYTNILAFDQTRVKLLPIEDSEGSDYINANYMPGFNSQREFIAAQGPLDNTIDDFWRMIWEQNCTIIVMLTNLMERNRPKCAQYWPHDQLEPVFYDDIQVKLRSTSVIGDYTVRVLDVSRGDRVRQIKQLHYIKWPDFGCPDDTNCLLNFIKVVRQDINPDMLGPVMVHCSAGVGRTGTFICVDRLLQHIRNNDKLDVFNTVLEMRGFRCTMVQSEDQYIYIHDCLCDVIERGLHKGDEQAVYSNFGFEEEGEDEPLYENYTGPEASMATDRV